jgi:hypothetical protein
MVAIQTGTPVVAQPVFQNTALFEFFHAQCVSGVIGSRARRISYNRRIATVCASKVPATAA